MKIEMEDLTEPGDSGIDTIVITTARNGVAINQALFPKESGMEQNPQNTDENRVSDEATADAISKLTKSNDKEKREIDVNNRIKEYRTVS